MPHQPAAPVEADALRPLAQSISHARIPATLKLLLLALLAALSVATYARHPLRRPHMDWLLSITTDTTEDPDSAWDPYVLRRFRRPRAPNAVTRPKSPRIRHESPASRGDHAWPKLGGLWKLFFSERVRFRGMDPPLPNLGPVTLRDRGSVEVQVCVASTYGRCGYRRITVLLRAEGRHVYAKRVALIWRCEGPRLPPGWPAAGMRPGQRLVPRWHTGPASVFAQAGRSGATARSELARSAGPGVAGRHAWNWRYRASAAAGAALRRPWCAGIPLA